MGPRRIEVQKDVLAKVYWIKIFCVQEMFGFKKLWIEKDFSSKGYCDQNFGWKFFFGTNMSGSRKNYVQIYFWSTNSLVPEIFGLKSVLGSKRFLVQNGIWKRLDPKIFWVGK